MDYNHYRAHSSLYYMAPTAFGELCLEQGSCSLRLTQDKESAGKVEKTITIKCYGWYNEKMACVGTMCYYIL